MQRALLLPEIVSSILDAGKAEPHLLYNCLSVNKLFCLEACRILWRGCYSMFNVGHPTPKVRHLGEMVLRKDIGLDRAQFYANFIHVLIFEEDGTDKDQCTDEARWHPQFQQLHFPRLEELVVWNTELAEQLNTEEAILHYVVPSLRRLDLHASGPLSNILLEETSNRCLKLRYLRIESRDTTISTDGLVHFLQRMFSLESLEIGLGLEGIWSQDALAAISRYERLEFLKIPAVQESWLATPEFSSNPTIFRALKHFYCSGLRGVTLSQLHDSNSQLQTLHIYNEEFDETDDVLPAAAQFDQLTTFQFQPGLGTCITGQELVQLARGCPNLTSLSIGMDQATPPSAKSMTDSVIDALAQSLPCIKELYLYFDSETRPGISSLLQSFSRYCPNLESLNISCKADWRSITALPNIALFPKLWSLTLQPSDHMEQCLIEEDFKMVLDHWKTHAPVWLPKVDYFTIEDADDREQEFDDFMFDVAFRKGKNSEEDDRVEKNTNEEEKCGGEEGSFDQRSDSDEADYEDHTS
jgi:hypothetical protein